MECARIARVKVVGDEWAYVGERDKDRKECVCVCVCVCVCYVHGCLPSMLCSHIPEYTLEYKKGDPPHTHAPCSHTHSSLSHTGYCPIAAVPVRFATQEGRGVFPCKAASMPRGSPRKAKGRP